MDKILYNGNLHTLDKKYEGATAIAIKDGIILRVGQDDEILALKTEDTELIDLQKNTVLPGFMDTHMHLLFYAISKQRVDLTGVDSFAKVKELCGQRVEQARAEGGWVQGGNFNQVGWPDLDRIPTRTDLDEIAEDVPVYLNRTCGHVVCFNTLGLKKVGLWDEKPDTKKYMDFGEDGKPNGYVRENTGLEASSKLMNFTVEEMKDMIEEAAIDATKQGITQIDSDDMNLVVEGDYQNVIRAFKELCEEGRLPIRVVEQCRFATPALLKEFLDAGYRSGDTFGRFTFGPIKVMGDGSIGSFTAALREPYKNNPSTKGILVHTDEEMYEIFKLAYSHGFPIVTHCIGDAALEQVCNTLDIVQKEFPTVDNRSGIIHCQMMDEELQDRFVKQNLIAYVQPVFIKADSKVVDAYVGPELAKQSYNWRRYADLGVVMGGGSDCPVEPFDILPNIFHAVTRKSEVGGEAWYPENGVTMEEAVNMFTKDAAYVSKDENRLGTITVGKIADLVVLDKDILANEPEELFNTHVLMTMCDGEFTYKR